MNSIPPKNVDSFCTALDDLGLLKISAPDALTFLQGQLTCDLNLLSETQSSLGCCCDRKGRVLFSFRIYRKDQNYYLYLPKSMLENALQHLRKYVIIAKVSLNIHETKFFAFYGKNGLNWLGDQFPNMPTQFGAARQIENETLICVDEENPRYLLITNRSYELTTANNDEWNFLELQQGLVTIYPETQALFIPQMLDYEKWGAVSFSKGCYVGQEIVARTQHLGKLKRHLHRLDSAKLMKRGEAVLNAENEVIGTVAECCKTPDGGFTVLAVMRD